MIEQSVCLPVRLWDNRTFLFLRRGLCLKSLREIVFYLVVVAFGRCVSPREVSFDRPHPRRNITSILSVPSFTLRLFALLPIQKIIVNVVVCCIEVVLITITLYYF